MGLHLGDARLEALDLRCGVNDLCQGALLPRKMGLLLQVAKRDVAGKVDRALIGLLLTHDDAQKRRLPGAVRPHQTPALTRVELQRCLRIQDAAAKRLRYLVCKCYQVLPPMRQGDVPSVSFE